VRKESLDRGYRRLLSGVAIALFLVPFSTLHAVSQTQTLDARIEGSVTDTAGDSIRLVRITALNNDTGIQRVTVSNEYGFFSLQFLPLGRYTVVVEHEGFRRYERQGVNLSAGQTVTIAVSLDAGSRDETITVTSDAPVADPSKFEVGRLINSREVSNLPLVSRNPLNFILQQPATTGRAGSGPGVVSVSSNGLLRRVAYQLDGGYNNHPDLGGFRLTFISEVFVKEVQVLTSGYTAEFGNTAGMVVNVITRSGTNDFDGALALLYRPTALSSKPFGFTPSSPDPNLNTFGFTAAIGGPIIRNRWHFYAGYDWTRRKDNEPITVSELNKASLVAAGIPQSVFVNSDGTTDTLPYFIFRTDAEISRSTRINFRYNRFDNNLVNNNVGELQSTEQGFNLSGRDHAFAAQAVTTFSETLLNEFRFQRVERYLENAKGKNAAAAPSIDITNAVSLGPNVSLGSHEDLSSTQFQNTLTMVREGHSFKAGGGINFFYNNDAIAVFRRYTFPDVQSYLNARSGVNRRSYSRYTETFGDPETTNNEWFLTAFIVDEWRVTSRFRITAGLRYDRFTPPDGDPNATLTISREFRVDNTNFAPRLAFAYSARTGRYQTVVRGGAGMYYDPPFMQMYSRAILNNGNPRFFSFEFTSGDPGSPNFPNAMGTFPPGTSIPRRNVDAVAPDFSTMYAVHSNIQVEQALSENLSITGAYLFSVARHIPVYRNTNCLPVVGTLADGRPIYGTVRNVSASGAVQIEACTQPIYPEFRQIKLAESVGNLSYHGFFVQLTKRFSKGIQASASYTVSSARDDAPEENVPRSTTQSDPSNRALDRGISWGDVRQVVRATVVANLRFNFANNVINRILNNNQLALIGFADSGENFNVTANFDLNRDGVSGNTGPDRPVGIERNSFRIPAFFNLEARYSRFFRLKNETFVEAYVEATNVFNAKYVASYRGTQLPAANLFTSIVNPLTGELRGPVPAFTDAQANWRESRQVQLGLKFHF
jgi:Carboxypeptidase regulatory-like domain